MMQASLNLLLIDDDDLFLDINQQVFERKYGWPCQTASSGQKGIELLGKCAELPDVVVVDMAMPEMDGHKVIEVLRDKWSDLCIVGLTGSESYQEIRAAIQATQKGADHYLLKPIDYDELVYNLQLTYERRRLQIEAQEPPSQQLDNISQRLKEMDAKLDVLVEHRKAVLKHFDASHKVLVATVVEQLNSSQLAVTENVLDAIDAISVPDTELQATFDRLQEALSGIRQGQLALSAPTLAHETTDISAALADPQLSLKSKLKFSVPLIPLILSYEGELALGNKANLEKVWQWFVAKAGGDK